MSNILAIEQYPDLTGTIIYFNNDDGTKSYWKVFRLPVSTSVDYHYPVIGCDQFGKESIQRNDFSADMVVDLIDGRLREFGGIVQTPTAGIIVHGEKTTISNVDELWAEIQSNQREIERISKKKVGDGTLDHLEIGKFD